MSKKGKINKYETRESRTTTKNYKIDEKWRFPIGGLIYTILVIATGFAWWTLWNNNVYPVVQQFIAMQSGSMSPETLIAFQSIDIGSLIIEIALLLITFSLFWPFLFLGIRAWWKGGRSW